MGRPRKNVSLDAQMEQAEALVLKKKEELDKAVEALKLLREKAEKAKQEQLLNAVAKSKWSYDKILAFIQSDPEEVDEK